MIYDSIANLAKYNGVFKTVADYLGSVDVNSLELGKYEIADGIMMSVQCYNSKPQNDKVCEVHEEKADIQYIYGGMEKMAFGQVVESDAKIPYNPEKDVAHHNAELTVDFIVKAGYFCAYFPGEFHKPGLCITEPKEVKKILVKINKELL